MIGRFDKMRDFLEFIGRLAQVPDIEGKLPDRNELMQWMQQMMAMQAQQAQFQEGKGEQSGAVASPEATGGEEQNTEPLE